MIYPIKSPMYQSRFEDSYQSDGNTDFPHMLKYKDLMEARQKRLEEKTKSTGTLGLTRTLDTSISATKLPPLRQKPQQQTTLLKKLNYDFGSLKEFLSYDLKLTKPEDLFKSITISSLCINSTHV